VTDIFLNSKISIFLHEYACVILLFSIEECTKNYWKFRFTRHGLVVTTTTKQSQLKTKSNQIQETNINTTTIDILEKSSSYCSLIEYLNKDNKKINSRTKENLNKLQKITDDVKLLTKQLQLSIEFNKNNNSSLFTLGKLNLLFSF